MYIKGQNDIKELMKKTCLVSSNNCYFSSNLGMQINKPFQGMFLRGNKVLLENLVEKIEIGKDKEYIVSGFSTASKTYGETSFLKSIDKFEYIYSGENIKYSKKIGFLRNSNVLKLEYTISNYSMENVNFKLIPFVTYRDMFNMKKSNLLNFNTRDIDSGCIINLSITESCDLCIKSDNAKFRKRNEYFNNITHECMTLKYSNNLFIEDVFIPCEYLVKLSPLEEDFKFNIYISDKEISEDEMNLEYEKIDFINRFEIAEEYPELIKLSKAVIKFDNNKFLTKIPYEFDIDLNINKNKNLNTVINELIEIVKSINGRYLALNRFMECEKTLKKILEYINKIESKEEYNVMLLLKLKLWTILQIYEYSIKYENINVDLLMFVKDTIDSLDFKHYYENNCLDELEIICLLYNAYKLYEDIFETNIYDNVAESLKSFVFDSFWNNETKSLKNNLNDDKKSFNVSIIYALSLPFSIVDEDIYFKLLDTIFKELYTPFGLRKYPKDSENYDGNIYPKYMADFVIANLKQNGSSVSSKKIIYNLVKELLQEIDKDIQNGIKSVYNEKRDMLELEAIDLITIAESIRLYEMLV